MITADMLYNMIFVWICYEIAGIVFPGFRVNLWQSDTGAFTGVVWMVFTGVYGVWVVAGILVAPWLFFAGFLFYLVVVTKLKQRVLHTGYPLYRIMRLDAILCSLYLLTLTMVHFSG